MTLEDLAALRRQAVEQLLAKRERAAQQRLEDAVGRSGIPERFQQKSFDQFKAVTPVQKQVLGLCRAYAERIAEAHNPGDNLMLLGGVGTGKTHLACAALAQAIRAGRTGLFISVAEALRMMRDTYSPGATRSESAVLAVLTEPDVLVVDEVGMAIGHDEKRQAMLFDILNTRYAAMRSNILLGNLTTQEMETYLGERLMDRLSEGDSAVICLDWPSYRRSHGGVAVERTHLPDSDG